MFLKQQQQKNNVFFDSYGELKKEAAFLYTPRKDINHAFIVYRNKASVGYMLMWIFVADMARPRETN